MWLVITMGLRFQDLLKLKFIDGDNLVKYFKLIERKNKNLCERYVPTSLIEMIIASSSSYPATATRLRKAVQRCLM